MSSSERTAYFEELRAAMRLCADEKNSVFMGQAVLYPGTAMYRTLEDIPTDQRVEMPVAEDMQMGMAIGAAIDGMLPITIYPRWNFLLLAASQLVLHLDKLPLYSRFRPKVIIRTAVATPDPLNPGPQHLADYTSAFEKMLRTVKCFQLRRAADVMPMYRQALTRNGSSLLVEYTELYA